MTIFYHQLQGVWRAQPWMVTLYSFHASASLSGVHFTWGLAVTELFGPGTAPNTGIQPLLSTQVQATRYTTYQLSATSNKKIDKEQTNISVFGTSAGVELPIGLACRVRLITGSTLPPGTGRMYLPPPTASNMSQGAWTAGAIATINAAVKAAFLKMYSPSLIPGVYSRKTLQLNGITDIATANVPGWIRSREKPDTSTYTPAHVFP